MKEQQFQQFAIVQGNTASILTEKLNQKLLFEPMEKGDRTVDERTKRGKCPCAKYGIAFSDGAVCDNFFRMLNEGGFELCLKK